MPKKVIPHRHTAESIEGFQWDGFRLSEFSRWYRGNFCYHAASNALVLDSTTVDIGDWVINEGTQFIILDNDEFEEEFDLAEDQ